jgi:hypothetical protein
MERNTKIMVAIGGVLLATGIWSSIASAKTKPTFDEMLSAKYPGYKVSEVPESSNVYLLISSEYVVIATKEDNIFGGVKVKEILKVSNVIPVALAEE